MVQHTGKYDLDDRLIQKYKPLIKSSKAIDFLLGETNELISIFVTSVNTAARNTSKWLLVMILTRYQ